MAKAEKGIERAVSEALEGESRMGAEKSALVSVKRLADVIRFESVWNGTSPTEIIRLLQRELGVRPPGRPRNHEK